ncbi:uncharacterized protein LOC131298653 [Rhododendron vialii]|uniref:uncharacterized protein LOC131298653 n=1 Tax=Rhododendron vialii TaxID=182163 RepID=UPI00265FF0E7|nr:uncharacterized protein LOC131298653 [Rhododendron vialii]
MAESGGGNGGNGSDRGGDDEVRPRGEPEIMGVRIDDPSTVEASSAIGVAVTNESGGGDGHARAAVGGDEGRTPGEVGRTPGSVGTGGPRVRRLDPRSGVEGLVITGLGSPGAGGSGSGSGSGSGNGGGQPGTPPRDPARGKGPVVKEGVSGEVPMEEVEFMPAVGSSAHVLITRGDFAEFVSEEELGRLLRENPRVVAAVLAAREDRLRQRGAASTRSHGGPASSLELYRGLPEQARALVDAAGFRPFILTLTAMKSDHALLNALTER